MHGNGVRIYMGFRRIFYLKMVPFNSYEPQESNGGLKILDPFSFRLVLGMVRTVAEKERVSS